jgi:hypothetical protein
MRWRGHWLSLLLTLRPLSQVFSRFKPVHVRRSFRTASSLPEFMSQRLGVLVPKDLDAALIHRLRAKLPGMLVSLLGMLKSSPGELLSGLMVLFLMGFGRTVMSVGGAIVQLGGPLMVLVMRSVVVACRHFQRLSISPDLLRASFASV